MERKYYECGKGWYPLIDSAEKIVAKYNKEHSDETEPIKFTQIKEKFGGLRLYINYGTSEIFDQLNALEDQSYSICEYCGAKENVKTEETRGWIYTLCDNCREKLMSGEHLF